MDVLRNLFKDDFAAKLDEGIAIGRAEGRDEGIAIGIARERQASIERLIAIGWSHKEAENLMNRVALRNAKVREFKLSAE